jgi:hypothetical protein
MSSILETSLILAIALAVTIEEFRVAYARATVWRRSNSLEIAACPEWILVADSLTFVLTAVCYGIASSLSFKVGALPLALLLVFSIWRSADARTTRLLVGTRGISIKRFLIGTRHLPYASIGVIAGQAAVGEPIGPYIFDREGQELVHLDKFWGSKNLIDELRARNVAVSDYMMADASRKRIGRRLWAIALNLLILWICASVLVAAT